MTSRSIHRDKPKEAIFKTLVQDYFLENPSTKEATISIGKTKRTDAQNRLYWCWVDIMSKEIGYAKQEMHLILADMFLTKISFTTKKGKFSSFSFYELVKISFAGAFGSFWGLGLAF